MDYQTKHQENILPELNNVKHKGMANTFFLIMETLIYIKSYGNNLKTATL